MKKVIHNNSKASLHDFEKSLNQVKVSVQEAKIWQGLDDIKQQDLKSLAKDLVKNNSKHFSFVLSKSNQGNPHERKIERIYSKNEIKQLVCDHLIADYQHEQIINAVTEYIYGIHVAN